MAAVGAQVVDAGAVAADGGLAAALVHVHARVPRRVQLEARPALALEAALQVVAGAVPADARPLRALVDVCSSITAYTVKLSSCSLKVDSTRVSFLSRPFFGVLLDV